MDNFKRLLLFVTIMLVVVLINSFGFAQTTYILRLGHNNAVTHPVNIGAKQFAKRVKERTNGKVQIQVYPAGQLGDERSLGEGMRLGTVDMMSSAGSMIGRFLPELSALEGGYLFRNVEHMEKVVKGKIGEKISEKLIKAADIRILHMYFQGERHLTTSNKPVRHPSDLKGMLIRVPQVDTYMAAFKALGASAVGIAFQEVYMALKMGVAEGQENPISSIHAMKFYEVQKYLTLTGHIIATGLYSINNKKYLSMPAELQRILKEEAVNAGDYTASLYKKEDMDLLPELKKYMTIIEVDKAEWQRAAQQGGMDEWFVKHLGKDLYLRIKDTK